MKSVSKCSIFAGQKCYVSAREIPMWSTMSGKLPNPDNISVNEIINLIENIPEKKRKKMLSQISGDVGNNQEM
ncbi:hypothetical protein GCM10009000_068990 [Halobacterium noricense]|uniref:Uncharacterized protein n=1 Tax=Haladaptatus pallidirubidus TaxID=1008152 RepID=A0AAV3UNX6_9EURY